MNGQRQQTGKRGEDEACSYLTGIGHTILERNWRFSHKEVDIISISGNELHIVEVKTKTEPVVADPLLNINQKKIRNLVVAANAYLNTAKKPFLPKNLEVIFDVITVIFSNHGTRIEYYPQAYIPTYA